MIRNLNLNLDDSLAYGKSKIMDQLDKSYDLIKGVTKNACFDNNINFKDLNELKLDHNNIFVDRVHLNDKGFEKIAGELKKCL